DGVTGPIPSTCADWPNQTLLNTCVPRPVNTTRRFSVVSVGRTHVCAIERVTKAAYCWGSNSEGQLGAGAFGTVVNKPTLPVTYNGRTVAFDGISAGGDHTCGLNDRGMVYCWGDRASLQTGPSYWTTLPFAVGGYHALAAMARSTCALNTSGWIECHGDRAVASGITLATIGRGPTSAHACGTNFNREVVCWGMNQQGEVGQAVTSPPTLHNPPLGVQMNGAYLKAQQVATGLVGSCALDAGAVYCWGVNWHGELGNGSLAFGTPPGAPTPSRVVTSEQFTSITYGDHHVCGLTATGAIYCWGSNHRGQLGIGQTRVHVNGVFINAVPTPTRVVGS
ncbi:MAG TPA: hypothetical protein VEA78_12745, partial [Acidimicrobiales bacterium]|nr:hypothetical protein [Acidimicrobiales bacterium]